MFISQKIFDYNHYSFPPQSTAVSCPRATSGRTQTLPKPIRIRPDVAPGQLFHETLSGQNHPGNAGILPATSNQIPPHHIQSSTFKVRCSKFSNPCAAKPLFPHIQRACERLSRIPYPVSAPAGRSYPRRRRKTPKTSANPTNTSVPGSGTTYTSTKLESAVGVPPIVVVATPAGSPNCVVNDTGDILNASCPICGSWKS